MTLSSASVTMLAACAARASFADRLQDSFSNEILRHLPDADAKRDTLDQASRGMFSRSILLRTLYFRERLRATLRPGSQLVLLSHGLDCELMKSGEHALFAVDHPASQRFTRAALEAAKIDVRVQFIAHDFARDTPSQLWSSLRAAGFSADAHSVVLWEGATYYLPETAVVPVLSSFASRCARVDLFADFLNHGGYFVNGRVVSPGVGQSLAFVESLGEPWVGFFQTDTLSRTLQDAGFQSVNCEDRSGVEQRILGERLMQPNMMFFMEAHK
ncbi:MAG TPA: class I SAM-dependent methyltransferase [Polyangiaceae bacterium]|nr:class I SAM-dependent methyltransferase [Polyangiaceae bacterium]